MYLTTAVMKESCAWIIKCMAQRFMYSCKTKICNFFKNYLMMRLIIMGVCT